MSQPSSDGAHDTRECHTRRNKKGIQATIPPRKNTLSLREEGHRRNGVVQALSAGERERWKIQSGYHQGSNVETPMYSYKQLMGPKLSRRDHNALVGEMLAGVKVLDKVKRLDMPVRQPFNSARKRHWETMA